jgi:hypothetical protein
MTLIQMRSGTAAQWLSADPILDNGELGFEYDTLKLKGGNGEDVWSALGYIGVVSLADEVEDFVNLAAFPTVGTSGIIYIANDTNLLYRWGGATYVNVGVNGASYVTLVGVETITNKTLVNPKINAIYDSNGNPMLNTAPVAGAVNFIAIQNHTTTNAPSVLASGSDINIDLNLVPQGTGSIVVYVTGATANIKAGGTGSNIDLNLQSKGTGLVKANGVAVLDLTTAQSPQNKTLDNTNILNVRDDRFTLQDGADTTKQARFNVQASQTTATLRTHVLPVEDTFLVGFGGTAPSVAVHADAGTGATATRTAGNRTALTISVTTGTGAVAGGTLATLTFFSYAFSAAPYVSLTPTNAPAATILPYVNKTATTVVIRAAGTPVDNTTYTFDLVVIG